MEKLSEKHESSKAQGPELNEELVVAQSEKRADLSLTSRDQQFRVGDLYSSFLAYDVRRMSTTAPSPEIVSSDRERVALELETKLANELA